MSDELRSMRRSLILTILSIDFTKKIPYIYRRSYKVVISVVSDLQVFRQANSTILWYLCLMFNFRIISFPLIILNAIITHINNIILYLLLKKLAIKRVESK